MNPNNTDVLQQAGINSADFYQLLDSLEVEEVIRVEVKLAGGASGEILGAARGHYKLGSKSAPPPYIAFLAESVGTEDEFIFLLPNYDLTDYDVGTGQYYILSYQYAFVTKEYVEANLQYFTYDGIGNPIVIFLILKNKAKGMT